MPIKAPNPPVKSKLTTTYVAGADPLAVGPPVLMHLAAELVGFQPELPVYDPEVAETLLEAYLPRLKAIPPERLDFPRVDVDAASRALLGVYAFTQAPPVHSILVAQAGAGQFDLANLERLRDATLVLIHVYRKAESAGSFATNAKVPAALDAESLEVEKRLQAVCEAFFPSHPLVIALRPGIGYVDRAYDLLGYADVYVENAAAVSGHVQYRATDVADARRLAGQLLAVLDAGMNPQQQIAIDQLRRVWTFLLAVYFEVRHVGLAALRYEPSREERFPSVYLAGRKSSPRKKGGKGEAAPDGVAVPVAEGKVVK